MAKLSRERQLYRAAKNLLISDGIPARQAQRGLKIRCDILTDLSEVGAIGPGQFPDDVGEWLRNGGRVPQLLLDAISSSELGPTVIRLLQRPGR